MIIERAKVIAAYRRARALGSDHETACAATAQALGIAIESAREVTSWCCERGEALGVQVCPECAEISAAYSAAMRLVREGDPA